MRIPLDELVRRQDPFGGDSGSPDSPDDPSSPSTTTALATPIITSTPTATSSSTSDSDSGTGGSNTALIIAFVVVLASIVLIITALIVSRRLRRRYPNPRFIPSKYLKQKWSNWDPSSRYNRNAGIPLTSEAPVSQATAVDRHTSVRSIATLPAYMKDPSPNEQVLGREGERGGIDIVVELPETAEEEENRREEEQEALYQIRVARRQEISDREERRRLREEARARGDDATLRELRRESQRRIRGNSDVSQAANGSRTNVSAALLFTDHQSRVAQRERDRRVSSVSYADVGLARHDGSRVRASSQDSDHRPLLDSAASIGSGRPRGHSAASSMRSVSTASDEMPSSDYEPVTLEETHSASTSRHSPPESNQVASPPPPNYDELGWEEVQAPAPPYPASAGPRDEPPTLPPLSINVPEIQVIGSTPAATPVVPHPQQHEEEPENDHGETER